MKIADWLKELLMALLEGALQTWSTSLTLIAANLIPLAGLLWFDWPVRTVLFVFWAETMVIGAWTLPKLALVSGWRALVYVPALALVLAGPCLFVSLVITSMADLAAYPDMDFYSRSLLQEKRWSIAMFAVSHGLSFAYHFIWRGEFRRHTPGRVVMDFARRVGVVLIAFGLASLTASAVYGPLVLLLVMAAVKTPLDLWLHLREHGMLGPETAGDPAGPAAGAAAKTGMKDPGSAFALGLFFGPLGMLYATAAGATVMLFLVVPLAYLGFGLGTGLLIWMGMENSGGEPVRLAVFLFLVIAIPWMFVFLPCGYWAWRAARAHNRRLAAGTGRSETETG